MRAAAMFMRIFGGMEEVHQSRLVCLSKVVAAVLVAGRVSLTQVGRRLARKGAAAKHAIKLVDRVLGNVHLHAEILLFYRRISKGLPTRERPIVLLDWTDIGKHWAALVATLVSEGRGIPICSEVHPRKKENNPQVEASLLRRLREILPAGLPPILVADAGFRGPWIKKVLSEGWDFVVRIRGRVLVRRKGTRTWRMVKKLWGEASASPKDLGTYSIAKYLPVAARIIAVKKRASTHKALPDIGRRKKRNIRSAREPWILATSLCQPPPRHITRIYAMRMRIEQTFRDGKCLRFGLGLDDIKTKQQKRAEVYLLLVTLANYLATLIGAAAESLGLQRPYQANTLKRRVLSWARLGREILLNPSMDARALLSPGLLTQLPIEPETYAFMIRGDP